MPQPERDALVGKSLCSRYVRKLIGQPMRRTELRYDQTLRDLMVMRVPNSTNFKVTPEQWLRVYQLKG
jgi:hypothetical protein